MTAQASKCPGANPSASVESIALFPGYGDVSAEAECARWVGTGPLIAQEEAFLAHMGSPVRVRVDWPKVGWVRGFAGRWRRRTECSVPFVSQSDRGPEHPLSLVVWSSSRQRRVNRHREKTNSDPNTHTCTYTVQYVPAHTKLTFARGWGYRVTARPKDDRSLLE